MSGLLQRFARPVGVLAAATALCSTATTVGSFTPPAAAATTVSLKTFDARLIGYINRARVNHGLRRLIVVAGTTDVAHGWSCRLAGVHELVHNGALANQLETHGSANWTAYGENIGVV